MKKKAFIFVALMMSFSFIAFFTRPMSAYTFANTACNPCTLSDFKDFEKELMAELNKSVVSIESIIDDSESHDFEDVEENLFGSRRLIIKGNIGNNYGAYKDICGYRDYHILCYSTIEQTENAYYKLLSKKVNVRPDEIVEIESASSENYQDYNTYNSWGAKYMDVANYISYLKGLDNTKEIVVAVLDTGINTSHEIFENRILEDSNNKFVGFSYYPTTYTYSGYDFEDDNEHGTHVAGTICELTPSNVKILPIKVLNYEGKAYDSQVLLGYTKIIEEYSLEYNIACINTSVSGFQRYGNEYVSLLNKNIIPIVAAGNDSRSIAHLIDENENSDKCVLVSAVRKCYGENIQFDSSYSNYGKGIDISAPGSNIKSAGIGDNGDSPVTDKYCTKTGTSMATPHVSAAVALLSLGLKDGYTADVLIDRLIDSALDYGVPGYDNYYGYGFVNCKNLQYNKADVRLDIKVDNKSLDLTKDNTNIVYESDLELTFECSDNSFVIKYTTDGTTPSIYSSTYTQKLHVLTSDNLVNYNIIAYKVDNLGQIEEYSSLYNVSFIYKNADIEDCVTVDSKGFITEYWGVHENVVIPEKINGVTITGIDKSAFGWHENLQSIELPETCKHLGETAFKCDKNLKYIYAPGVETIDVNAFGYCESLPFVTSDAKPENAQEGAYFPVLKQFSEKYISSSKFPSSGAIFYGCDSIRYVKLTSLEGCSKDSFSSLKNLTSCILPKVDSLDGEFKYCANLVEVDISNVTSISGSFKNCKNLEYLYAPKLTSIGALCFSDCEKLKTLSSSDVKTENQKGVFLPSLETVAEKAFSGSYFKTLNLQGVKKLYYLGVMNYLEDIYLYDVERLCVTGNAYSGWTRVFDDCPILTKVVIGNSFDYYDINFTDDQVIYCFENSKIHKVAQREKWKFKLLNQYDFTKNLDSVTEKNENETLNISIDAAWAVHYQWYITEDNIENGIPLVGENDKSININPGFDTTKKLYCKVISWDNSTQYSNITTIAFGSSFQTYEIVFKNPNGQIIETKYMRKGQMPYYDSNIPTLESSPQYDYIFKGWDKAFTEVNGDQEYIAQYKEKLRFYKVAFLNYDGNILSTLVLEYGSIVPDNYSTYSFGAKKESSAKYYYTFRGWDKEFTTVTSDQEYTAVFNENLRSYLISFVNYNDSIIFQYSCYYGEIPKYTYTIPTRPKDVQYTYKFKGWDKEFLAVTGEARYKAVYDGVLNKYRVIFYNYNWEILQSQLEDYGTIPTYHGEIPFKPSSATEDYTFLKWYSTIQEVTGNTSYHAIFSSSPSTIVSSLSDDNGTVVIEGYDNINAKWKLELNSAESDQIKGTNYKNKLNKNVRFLTAFTIDIKQNGKNADIGYKPNYNVKLKIDEEYQDKKILLYCLTKDGSLIKINVNKENNQLLFDNESNVTYIMLEDLSFTTYLQIILIVGLSTIILLVVVIIVIKKKKRKAL